jgi:hypothetical protein
MYLVVVPAHRVFRHGGGEVNIHFHPTPLPLPFSVLSSPHFNLHLPSLFLPLSLFHPPF